MIGTWLWAQDAERLAREFKASKDRCSVLEDSMARLRGELAGMDAFREVRSVRSTSDNLLQMLSHAIELSLATLTFIPSSQNA